MGFNILQFLKDYGVENTVNHKHSSVGWIQIHCPFCGDSNFHAGIPIDNPKVVNCWKCGKHSLFETIKEHLNFPSSKVFSILKEYETEGLSLFREKQEESRTKKEIKFPTGTGPITNTHRKYLLNRRFDPEAVEKEWGVLGTGPLGDYKHRIIIPIHFQGEIVSYQGRDITGKASARYKFCPSEREVRSAKHCLYGIDKTKEDSVIVVEGATDVWRMGGGRAVATFGINWSKEQVLLLVRFKRVDIMYDNEPYAQKQAEKLSTELAIVGVETRVCVLEGVKDPGEMIDYPTL